MELGGDKTWEGLGARNWRTAVVLFYAHGHYIVITASGTVVLMPSSSLLLLVVFELSPVLSCHCSVVLTCPAGVAPICSAIQPGCSSFASDMGVLLCCALCSTAVLVRVFLIS